MHIQFKVLVCGLLLTVSASTQAADVAMLLQKSLPDLDDREVLMLTVDYAPGGASPVHRHDAHTFVYVLQGTVVMQVKGQDEVTLSTGATFYETPEDIHVVSRNASQTEPARILVFFVKRVGAAPTRPAD
jgi:quercetin dioxygenase-like cupin family protein